MKVWMVTLVDGTSYQQQPREFKGLFSSKDKAIASLPYWANKHKTVSYGEEQEYWGADGWNYYITEEEVI